MTAPSGTERGRDPAPRWGRPRALRRQLVAVLVVVLLAFTCALAIASTLALRSQLVSRLDQQLTQASDRLTNAPPRSESPDRPTSSQAPEPSSAGEADAPTDPVPTDPGPVSPGPQPDVDQPFFPWLGQETGTIVVTYTGDEVNRAGFVSGSGFTDLDDAQVADLEAVPEDGRPHDVEVTGLGSYRAISATTSRGEPSIVALSTVDVTETVERYLAVEAILAAVGVVLAGVVGTLLVRRSLRPLDAVAEAAASVSELELSRGEVGDIPRVDAAHTDERTEVGQVGAALNRMLENVESSLVARHESETQVRQFVADASHELRTPLTSIRGYAELVRRSPDTVPPDTLRALDRIESESGRMSALVEDLLLLARLDAGRPLADAPVDLTALALDALADAHAASPAHRWELELPGDGAPDGFGDGAPDGRDDRASDGFGDGAPDGFGDGAPDGRDDGASDRIGLRVEGVGSDGSGNGDAGDETDESDNVTRDTDAGDTDEEPPDVIVRGDEARLRQVLTNLLANARVHTPPGTRVVLGLRIDAGAEADGPGGTVVVSVADDGPGIPAALRGSLFQRFTRGDSARNRAGGSTGLGLAIAQSIVAAHGGTIAVRSRTGTGTAMAAGAATGSVFEVRLPRA